MYSFDNLIYARLLMGGSLVFHIIFAAIGIALPFFFVLTETCWLITKDDSYLKVTRFWAKILAVLFAVGAVSGTVLSFELGLLWPKFMELSGPVIGIFFTLEAVAFFIEAIFIGLYLYAWDHVSRLAHWFCGLMIALGGISSAIFVFATNVWMHDPKGFTIEQDIATNIDPLEILRSPMYIPMTLHMIIAAFLATILLVMSVHAYLILKTKNKLSINKTTLNLGMIIFIILLPLQIISGDYLAKALAITQPAKLAAMEALYHSQSQAPIIFAGIPDDETMTVSHAIKIPKLLSYLAYQDEDSIVLGLDAFARELWPNVKITHWAFDLMLFCAFLLSFLALLIIFIYLVKRNLFYEGWFLNLLILLSPLGFIGIEAGWISTEVGRQPWIINNVMKTSEALVSGQTIAPFCYVFLLLYLSLLIISMCLIIKLIKNFEAKSYDPI